MSALKVGILGAGGIAHKLHLPQLARMDDVKVTVAAGRKEHRLKTICDRFGVPNWTQDFDAVLSDDSLDIIVIATPHPHHVSYGIKALEAGKHVMMQKPLCGDMDEANAFVEAVDRCGRICFCLPHFSPYIYAIRDGIQKGDIGTVSGALARHSHGGPEVYYAEVRDAFEEKDEDLWFFDPKRASVGSLFDMGVYAVAALVAALGSVQNVIGRTKTIAKPTTLDDTATLLLEMANGALATAETGWCDPARTSLYRVHGTAGKYMVPGHDGAVLTHWTPGSYTREDIPPVPHPVDLASYQKGNAHELLLDCIRRDEQPELSNAHAARHVTEILLAGMTSSAEGRVVNIESIAEDR